MMNVNTQSLCMRVRMYQQIYIHVYIRVCVCPCGFSTAAWALGRGSLGMEEMGGVGAHRAVGLP